MVCHFGNWLPTFKMGCPFLEWIVSLWNWQDTSVHLWSWLSIAEIGLSCMSGNGRPCEKLATSTSSHFWNWQAICGRLAICGWPAISILKLVCTIVQGRNGDRGSKGWDPKGWDHGSAGGISDHKPWSKDHKQWDWNHQFYEGSGCTISVDAGTTVLESVVRNLCQNVTRDQRWKKHN